MSTELEAHERLCEQRYAEINRRLDNIEHEVKAITTTIDSFKNSLLAISAKVGIGAVIALFSAVYVVKFH
jgi:tetrahydromethanopterin S-methyltransferase subunit G